MTATKWPVYFSTDICWGMVPPQQRFLDEQGNPGLVACPACHLLLVMREDRRRQCTPGVLWIALAIDKREPEETWDDWS